MSKFMMLIRNEGDGMANLTEQERGEHMQAWGAYMGGLGEKLLDGLPFSPAGSVVTSGGVNDGKHSEGGVNVGGYLVVEAGDLQEAIELSKACPALENKTSSIEVRECLNM